MPSFTDMNCRHNNKKEWHASTLTLVIIFKVYTVWTLCKKKSSLNNRFYSLHCFSFFLFFAIFPDNKPKDIPYSGTGEKDLPAQRHREVLDGLL